MAMKDISQDNQRNYVYIENIVMIYCSLERRVLSIDNEEIYYEKEYYEETE